MKSHDIKIDIIRCNVFSETHRNGVKILYHHVLQVDNIKRLIRDLTLKIGPEYRVNSSKLTIDLGEVSFEYFETQFNAKFSKALIENIMRLSACSSEKLQLPSVADRPMENTLFPAFSHYPNSDIYQLACQCLHPTILPQLMKTWGPNELQCLLKQLVEKNDNFQTTSYPPTNARISASKLSLTALSYLLNHEQGARWLSENYPNSEQLRIWTEAIIHGEIRAEQVLQLLDVQNLPHIQQQSIITHRWLQPLWQRSIVRNIIGKRFGRNVIARLEKHYETTFSHSQSLQPLQCVSNAGLLLLWPLLPQLFSLLELCEEGEFINDRARWQAVNCLDWLVWEEEEHTGGRFTVCQLLCGIPLDTPLPEYSPITRQQRQQVDDWLSAVSQQLPAWKKLSLNDIRQLFLRRPGELVAESQPPQIIVQSESFDLLLRDWPWPMTLALLPWLNQPLTIIWPLNG